MAHLDSIGAPVPGALPAGGAAAPAGAASLRRWNELALACAIATIAVVLAVRSATPAFIGEDEGVYAALGASIATTGEYRLINLPSRPNETKYPPLYPALLAMAWIVDPAPPGNIPTLKHVNAVLLGIVALLYWMLVRRSSGLGRGERALGVAAIVFGPALFSFSDMLTSELAFVALEVATLALVPVGIPLSRRRGAVLGVVVALSALTRTIGIALVAAVVWHAVREWGPRRASIVALTVLIVLAPWIAWVSLATDHSVGPLEQFYIGYEPSAWSHLARDPWLALRMLRVNAMLYADAVPIVFGLYVVPIGLAFGVLAGAGMAWGPSAEGRRLLVRVAAVYLVAIIGHPIPMGRYLIPYVPICGLFLLAGLEAVGTHAGWAGRAGRVAGVAALACIVAGNGLWLRHFAREADRPQWHFGLRTTFGWSGFLEVSAWIRRNTPRDAHLASAFGTVYFIQTGRPAVRPWLHRPEEYQPLYGRYLAGGTSAPLVADALERLDVTYLVVDPLGGAGESAHALQTIRDVLAREPGRWRLVFVSSDRLHRVYERDRLRASLANGSLPVTMSDVLPSGRYRATPLPSTRSGARTRRGLPRRSRCGRREGPGRTSPTRRDMRT